jgi:hypothetical protein
VVLHPPRRLAPSHAVHDHSSHLVSVFSDWLRHLSRAGWREVFRIHWLARWGLLSDPGLPRSAGLCDAAVGHFDACSGFSSPMGPAQADRALDDPNLALRVCHRSPCLFNALQMVPSAGALATVASTVFSGLPGDAQFRDALKTTHLPRGTRKSLRRQNLALRDDLMFDQSHMPPRMKETLW